MQHFFKVNPAGIVFDDDIIPSQAFFPYMDFSLAHFESDKTVFAINGWTPFLEKEKISSSHLTRYFVSWGWATWSDRFSLIDFDLTNYSRDIWWKQGTIKELRANLGFRRYWTKRFNLITSDSQNKSWDWEFLSEMWRMNGMCISPPERLVTNIGYDQYASHPNFGSHRQKAFAREEFNPLSLGFEPTYNLKIDLRYERLMWDLGFQRILSSIRYRCQRIFNSIS
jgi:hypothetical protein